MSLKISVQGLRELVSALNRIANFKVPMNDAIELFLQKVVVTAQGIVPVRTGRLQRSIGFGGGDGEWWVGTRLFYAGFVEFGTRYMSAQPYLRPSLNQNLPDLKLFLVDRVEAWLMERGR